MPPPSAAVLRKKLQAASAIPFALFVGLHMGTHFSFHWGSDRHRAWFLWARKFYNESPAMEAALLGSTAFHAALSLYEAWRRTPEENEGVAKDPVRAANLGLGYVLVLLVPVHTYFGRVENVRSGINDPEIGTFATRFLPEVFVPYYITLALAGVLHGSLGLIKAARILKAPIQPSARSRIVQVLMGVASLASASTILAMAGWYFPVSHLKYREILAYQESKFPNKALFQFLQRRYLTQTGLTL